MHVHVQVGVLRATCTERVQQKHLQVAQQTNHQGCALAGPDGSQAAETRQHSPKTVLRPCHCKDACYSQQSCATVAHTRDGASPTAVRAVKTVCPAVACRGRLLPVWLCIACRAVLQRGWPGWVGVVVAPAAGIDLGAVNLLDCDGGSKAIRAVHCSSRLRSNGRMLLGLESCAVLLIWRSLKVRQQNLYPHR